MSNYYTKGTKHRKQRKDYDYLYNKGYSWNNVFDRIFRELIGKSNNLIFSRHLQEYNKDSNRDFDLNEISLENISNGDLVEVETEINDYNNEDFQAIKKCVVRLPQREDGEQIVVVIDFRYNADAFIKTAWLNKSSDNHTSGLDTTEFDFDTRGKFGYFYGKFNSEVFEIKDYGSEPERLTPNVAITMEEWNRRNA